MPNTATFKDWLFVKIGPHIDSCIDGDVLCVVYNYGGRKGEDCYPDENEEIQLPSGSWQIIGKGDTLAEEQWREIDGVPEDTVISATESGHSLLKSLGMEPSETLVLKKQS